LVERICKEIFKGTDGTFHHGGSTDILVLGFIADNHIIKNNPPQVSQPAGDLHNNQQTN